MQDESSSTGVSLLDISLFPAHVVLALIASDYVFLVIWSTNGDAILTINKEHEYISDSKIISIYIIKIVISTIMTSYHIWGRVKFC